MVLEKTVLGKISLENRTVYLLLFSLTLLAVIAGSAAVIAIAGQGALVLSFAVGAAVGGGVVLSIVLSPGPAWLAQVLTGLRRKKALKGASDSCLADVHLEIECRRLLDRMGQLLETAVDERCYCRYCQVHNGHKESCPVPAASALYAAGKAKRVPWREFEKQFPNGVIANGIVANRPANRSVVSKGEK